MQPRSFPSLPDDWTSEWETFPSADGTLQLYAVQHHKKDWKGGRALIVFHGMGEHGGRYLHVPHYLQSVVDSVYCMDHRGHGRSEGLRGHVERFDLLSDDAALAICRLEDHLKKRFGKAEIHLLAHSMGGLVAIRTLFLHPQLPIVSASISAPLLGVKLEVPRVKKAAGIMLSRLWGSLHMTNEIDPRDVSHDLDVVKAYQEDRLVHNKITPRFYTELVAAMADTVSRDSGLNYPLQLMIPLEDKLCDSEASLGFFKNLKLRDKLLKTYPHFFHEILNETGKEEPFEDIKSWITQRSAALSN